MLRCMIVDPKNPGVKKKCVLDEAMGWVEYYSEVIEEMEKKRGKERGKVRRRRRRRRREGRGREEEEEEEEKGRRRRRRWISLRWL